MRLTLLTINVWSGLDYQGWLRIGDLETAGEREARYVHLFREISRLAPDVIAITEANPLPAYARRLARDLGYDEVHHVGLSGVRLGCARLPVNLCEGDAILAKSSLGLQWVGRQQLSGGWVGRYASVNFGNATQVICARLACGLHVLSTHLTAAVSARDYHHQIGPSTQREASLLRASDARRREMERLLLAAARLIPRDAPAVLMGDLNATPDAPEIARLADWGWHDAWAEGEGATWDSDRNPHIGRLYGETSRQRLDYVWVRPPAHAVTATLALEGPPAPSDHFGVLATVEL